MKKVLYIFIISILLIVNFPGLPVVAQEITITESPAPEPTQTPTPDPDSNLTQLPSPSPTSAPEQIPPMSDDNIKVLEESASPSPLQTLTDFSESAMSAQIDIPPYIHNLNKKDYRANEQLSVVVENAYAEDVTISIFNTDGEKVNVDVKKTRFGDPAIFKIFPLSSLKPGRYRLHIEAADGAVSDQEFTWGVLAINPNKSIYTPYENVNLSMAVLDETGMMVCDANLTLEITDPDNHITTLHTAAGSIIVNPECQIKDYVTKPDYEAHYQTQGAGSYRMSLTATTAKGTHTISDQFEVRDTVPFDIERQTATRIYPPVKYPVNINVHFNEDFEGLITEVVPNNFTVEPQEGTIPYTSISVASAKVTNSAIDEASIPPLRLPFNGLHGINQGFGGQHRDSLVNRKYTDFGVIGHDGVDFDLDMGTEVVAIDGGTVSRARENYDYGTTIIIEHSWGKSYYGHLSIMKVKEGDTVRKGDVIALSGNTGLSSGPHLHFGIKPTNNDFQNGYFGKINPAKYLGLNNEAEVHEDVAGASTELIENTDPSVKIVTWQVQAKKGDSLKLGYKYMAPQESPQFYLLGPLEFKNNSQETVFQESRQWQLAADAVTNNGRLYYGDATNTGVVKFQTHTNDFTFNGEVSTAVSTTASHIAYLVAKANPTRDETMMGHLKLDGRLDIIRCTGGCDAAGDFDTTNDQNVISNNAMSCGTTGTDCTRTFDVAYERLSGRAMVVYAGDTSDGGVVPDNQKLYYCYWDGTSWGPVSTCAPTDGSNDISLTSNGRPTFVTLKGRTGSNQILLGVQVDVAGTNEAEAYIWSGSAWGNGVVATDTTNLTTLTLEEGNSIDVEWEENNGDAFIIYGTAATVEVKYKRFTSGSWGSEQDAFDSASAGGDVMGMNADRDPNSNRILVVTNDDNNDLSAAVWKANGSTVGWTSYSSGIGETTLENIATGPPYTDGIWEPVGSSAIIVGQNASNADGAEYARLTCDGTGCTVATAITAVTSASGADDPSFVRLAASPNSDEIMFLIGDTDRILTAQHWDGTAWESADAGILEADYSGASGGDQGTCGATVCPDNVPAQFVYIPYSPWSRNWKFWQGTDTTNTPTNQLANENVAPTGITPETGKFRLRFSVAELSGMGQIDGRKKLQYAANASCTPDTVEGDTDCTWVDVDDPAGSGIWRYVDCNGGDANICNDNATLSGTTLSGSPTAGWWVQDKDAAGGAAMDQTALQLRELEFSVEANNATPNTTYYFRMYDVDQDSIVRREQDNDGSNDCASAACTYPSLTTGAAAGPTTDQIMRHGTWFSSGTEQPFFF